MTMEVENSNDLLSANWGPKKASGVLPVQTQRPENQGSQWHKSQIKSKGPRTRSPGVQGQEKMDVPAQA